MVTIRLQDADRHIPGIVTAIHQNGIGITSLTVRKPTLEDVFLHYTGRTIRDEATGKRRHECFIGQEAVDTDIVYTIWLRSIKRHCAKEQDHRHLGMPLFFMLVLGFGLNSIIQIRVPEKRGMGFIIPGIVAMSVLFTSVFRGSDHLG